MPPITPKQVKDIVDGAFDILDEASDLTSGRDPNYIRDAQPENVFDAIALAAARQGCRRYAEKGEAYSENRRARAERACRPYLDGIPGEDGPEIRLPFRGGQCAKAYLVNTTTGNEIFGIETFTMLARGPVGGIRARVDGPTVFYELFSRGLNVGQPACASIGDSGAAWRLIRTINSSQGPGQSTINSVTPCDGLDECGNPPPEVTAPKPSPNPLPPGPQPYNPTPDIDIDIDVEIGPDGDIIIDIGTGPITIDPFGDGGGDENPDPSEPTGPSDGPPGDPGTPGAPSEPEEGGESSGCAPAGSVLVGVRVQILEVPPSRNKYSDEVYRGAYYVYMGMPGLLDHDPAGAMATLDQFIFAEKDNLTCYRVRGNKGYKLRVTPYYREVE